MLRSLLLSAIAITVSSPTIAQTIGGPPIAYVKVGGTAQELYLVNPDGSGQRLLYTAPRKSAIGWVDLKPGGGEIAFTEFGNGKPRVIKVLGFDNIGAPNGPPRTITVTCGVDTVDYHPSESRLIISDFCPNDARIASINTDGTGYSILMTNAGSYLNKARWLMDGTSFVYVRAPLQGGPLQICRNACDANSGELLRTADSIVYLDVGRTTNNILYAGFANSVEISATGAVLRDPVVVGNGAHYSNDDTRILYETPHSAKGDFLYILNADGTTTRLSTKGEFGPTDWRK